MKNEYSLASDVAGVLVWAVIVIGFTSPIWLPIAAFFAGAAVVQMVVGT